MNDSTHINWKQLETFAEYITESGVSPGSIFETDWQGFQDAFQLLLNNEEWEGIIRLRNVFNALYARDTVGGLSLLQTLDDKAIEAARHINDYATLAHLLGAQGHNLHRRGYHQKAIEVFEESASLYKKVEEPFESLKNYFMTSLCHRALGNRAIALHILDSVLEQVSPDNPWRGNPLQVKAWLVQDEGKLEETETLLREILLLHSQTDNPDILLAGTLADLGEVVGLRGNFEQAQKIFLESLAILDKYPGQYARQVARTNLKFAEMLARQRKFDEAQNLLNKADDLVRGYGNYHDLMWRIELTRAFVYLRQGRIKSSIAKFRSTINYRKELNLSTRMLIRQLVIRLWMGSGLPR